MVMGCKTKKKRSVTACRHKDSEGEIRDSDDRCIAPSERAVERDRRSIEGSASSVRSRRGRTCKSIRSSGSRLDSEGKVGRENLDLPRAHRRHNALPRRKRFQTEEMRRDV